MEDMYGLKVSEIDGEPCLHPDKHDTENYSMMFNIFSTWQEQAALLEQGKITRDEYDEWRYNYPKKDTTGHWASVLPQELSDAFTEDH